MPERKVLLPAIMIIFKEHFITEPNERNYRFPPEDHKTLWYCTNVSKTKHDTHTHPNLIIVTPLYQLDNW